jgi:hypothetical protein
VASASRPHVRAVQVARRADDPATELHRLAPGRAGDASTESERFEPGARVIASAAAAASAAALLQRIHCLSARVHQDLYAYRKGVVQL